MIREAKQNIDLVEVVRASGVELKRVGNRYIALCPLHQDSSPSFYVFDNQRFKCFGCGESGDAIDFVQKYYGLSFKDALKHLGLEQGRITPETKRWIEQQKRRAELIKQFEKWRSDYLAHLGSMINRTERLMKTGIPPADLDLYAELLHGLPKWGWHSDILLNGSDRAKFELFKDLMT